MEKPIINRDTVRGKAYDVKRFNGAVVAIMATDLVTNDEVKILEEIRKNIKERYLGE